MTATFHSPTSDNALPVVLGDLSDALEILYSCRRLNVPVSDEFLDYIDKLIDMIEASRPYALPA